jgi:RNA-directed DNA polymerase
MSKDVLRTSAVKVRELQEKLHRSAKADKSRRFHQLYDKVCAPWFLEVAWQRVRANKGAPGPDGISIEAITTQGVDAFLEALSMDLRKRTYRAGPIRRVYIPKANGKLRPLGIPNVRDRVVQASVLLLLEPIFEADLPESAFGFRPGRDAHQAMETIAQHLLGRYTEVVDADLAAYFDTIPHSNLLRLVAERVVDRGVLQGGVISPLLANIYHACIPRIWSQWESTRRLGGKIVSYADDFVIMLRPGQGKLALEALERICTRLSLQLSEEKTRVVDATKDSFKFLGFHVQQVAYASGKTGPRVTPSPQAEQRLRDRLREILNRRAGCRPVPEVVGEVNAVLRGWTQYFNHGQPQLTMKRIKFFAEQRLRKWLMRRRHQRGPGYTQYPSDTLYSTYGLYKVPTSRPGVSRMPPAKETPRAGCRKPARPVR